MSKVVEDGAVEFSNVPKIEPDALDDKPIIPLAQPINRMLTLDESLADSENNMTQNGWIGYWNNVHDGRIFASMSDYYAVFKQIRYQALNSNLNEMLSAEGRDVSKLLKYLRDDKDIWLMTSTRIQYGTNPNNYLEGKIIHHYGCSDPTLIKATTLEIPLMTPMITDETISGVFDDPANLKFFQACFDTDDDGETIVQTLDLVYRKKIKLAAADMTLRTRFNERALAFYCGLGILYIDGSIDISLADGCSRGVRYRQS